MIPLTIIEEHNEAFYVWNHAAAMGHLPPFGNCLLHVDHHADFEHGGYRGFPDVLSGTLAALKAFTEEDLGIADFICPAIYQGLLSEIVFLREYRGTLTLPEQRTLTIDKEGSLRSAPLSAYTRATILKDGADHRFYTWREGGLQSTFETPQPLILDIDLDYFCWDNSLSTVPPKRLEITEAAYESLKHDPHHPFRMLPRAVVTAEEMDGRYYAVCREHLIPTPIPETALVAKRIEVFVRWLVRCRIRPRIVSICRSRLSGYTPVPMWEMVETTLLRQLGEVFDLDPQS